MNYQIYVKPVSKAVSSVEGYDQHGCIDYNVGGGRGHVCIIASDNFHLVSMKPIVTVI